MCLADSTGNSLQISTVKSKLSYFAIKKLSLSLFRSWRWHKVTWLWGFKGFRPQWGAVNSMTLMSSRPSSTRWLLTPCRDFRRHCYRRMMKKQTKPPWMKKHCGWNSSLQGASQPLVRRNPLASNDMQRCGAGQTRSVDMTASTP